MTENETPAAGDAPTDEQINETLEQLEALRLIVTGRALELIIEDSIAAELIDESMGCALRMAAMANTVSTDPALDDGGYFLTVELEANDAASYIESLGQYAKQRAALAQMVSDHNAARARASLPLVPDAAS